MLSLLARAQRRLFTSSSIVPSLSPSDVIHLSSKLRPLAAAAAADHAILSEHRTKASLSPSQTERLRATASIARLHASLTALDADLVEAHTILNDPSADHDLQTLARDEHSTLTEHSTSLSADIIAELLRADETSSPELDKASNAILELRAGAGGDEAALFVTDLTDMYTRLAARNSWRTRTLSRSETNLRGIREIILRVSGHAVYDTLRVEAGVHRVQRVPATETQGRLHTSTASVSVLKDDSTGKPVKINPADVRIDVFRASGAGGQHVNKTESAVRATHIPTGLVATSQEERSQHRNRAIALESLAARLAAKQAADERAARSSERRAQLGSSIGERSDRIRTYNFPQRRVTDHRIVPDNALLSIVPSAKNAVGEKSESLDRVLEGGVELTRLMDAVRRAEEFGRLKELVVLAEKARDDVVREPVAAKA